MNNRHHQSRPPVQFRQVEEASDRFQMLKYARVTLV
jgi:hypothetical protein